MKVLVIGVGGVGEAVAVIAREQDSDKSWLKQMVLADYSLTRAEEVSARLEDSTRFPPEQLNARDGSAIRNLVEKYAIDLILNCCDPSFNETIFDTAFETGCMYMDCAMSLSYPHPEEPYKKTHIKLGDYQFERSKAWEDKGLLAVIGTGVEPGMSDILARYAEKHLFDTIEEIGVRDGDNFSIDGVDIAFGFSIWTTIEECLNPPVIWERDKGWYTTEPFSEPEIFTLPEGIGDVEMVNVEHEEVLLIPRYIDKGLKRVTFKFGLGKEFIDCLKYLKALGLDSKDVSVPVGDSSITPRDFLAKCAPNPVEIGKKMKGKVCAGTWIKGMKNNMERQVYLHQVTDNQEVLERLGCQAVVAQTAFTPVIIMELLAKKIWDKTGVHGPEAFDPDPYVSRMQQYGFAGKLMEMDAPYKKAQEITNLTLTLEKTR